MPLTLNDVITGLKEGRRFMRKDGPMAYIEYVKPTGPEMFQHNIVGQNEQGGWGGAVRLPIEILSNGRWEQDGWEEDIM